MHPPAAALGPPAEHAAGPGHRPAPPAGVHDLPVARALGARIRALRRRRALTVKQLAERCRVTHSLISQVERGVTNPSLGSLYQIALALGVPMEALFRDEPSPTDAAPDAATAVAATRPGPLVRRSERRHLDLPGGLHWERLIAEPDSPHEFLEIRMDAGATTGPTPLRHGGREYVLVLEGVIRFEIGFQQYTLQPGDSIAFDSGAPHRSVNVGDMAARSIHFMLDYNP